MKRKGFYLPGAALFKWHVLAYIVFAIMASYSIIATITYAGNATVPFSAFRPFIIERISMIIIWGVILLLHYLLHQTRAFQQSRAHATHRDALDTIQRNYDTRRLEAHETGSDLIDADDEWQAEKRKNYRQSW